MEDEEIERKKIGEITKTSNSTERIIRILETLLRNERNDNIENNYE